MQDHYKLRAEDCMTGYCRGDDHPVPGTEDLYVWWSGAGDTYIKSLSKDFNVVLKYGDDMTAAQQLVHEIAAGQHRDLLLDFLLKRET